MKKSTIILSLLAISLLIVISCKKDDDSNDETTISGIIAEFKFNQESDLENWSFYSNDSAKMLIDYEVKVEGAASLKIQGGCSSIINQTGIPIEKEENYKISLNVKYDDFVQGEHCGGAFNLALVIIQGSESEWFSLYRENNEWYEQVYYYHSDGTGLPVQLRIYCGEENLWIDDMVMEKVD